MKKKAQGALEFLMTYGWAFLVILIMIGALAYFGILNPSKFLPDRCQFGSQVSCRQFVINSDDGTTGPTMALEVTNNFGRSVYVYSPTLTTDDQNLGTTNAEITNAAAAAGTFEAGFDIGGDGNLSAADDITGNTWFMGGAVPGTDNLWEEGTTKTILLKIGGGANLVSGDKKKMTLCLKYHETSTTATYGKDICGEVYTNVQ